MAYNFINRFSFYAKTKRPFLVAVFLMLLVVGYGFSLITNDKALAQLVDRINVGIIIFFFAVMLAGIFHKT